MRRKFDIFLLALLCILGPSMMLAQSTTGNILGQLAAATLGETSSLGPGI
jgi:hypothetical protein